MSRLSGNVIICQTFYESYKRRIWLAGAAVLLLVLLFSIGFISKTVTAQRAGSRQKLIASVEIKQGDTLWGIASSYISEEYGSISEYIEEIKASNGLISDEIHAGNYIIVPYYADISN